MMRLFLFLLMLFSYAPSSLGKPLNPWGVGVGTRGLGVKYFIHKNYAVSGHIHFESLSLSSEIANQNYSNSLRNYSFFGKIDGIISRKEFLRFHWSLAGAFQKDNKYVFEGLLGGEFFIPGLKELGFSFEGGLGVLTRKGVLQIKTLQYAPFAAGVFYYF